MNSFESRLKREIEKFVKGHLETYTPGLVVEAYLKGRKKIHLEMGDTYPYYDLASLTKIIFSATAFARYYTENWAELFQPIQHTLPWWKHSKTRPCDLLSHSAGLEWWQPYYKKLKGPIEPRSRWTQLEKLLKKVPITHAKKAVYSDLDLYLLGAYLQKRKDMSLEQIWREQRADFGFEKLDFHIKNKPKYKRGLYAPTEDCPWRKKILQGEVHDENSWALGGIAPHAGLFGPISEVSRWGLTLRRAVLGEKTAFGDPIVIREFTKRQIPRSIGDWGYGFMKPSLRKASAGSKFSKASFGHTAFTGPSFWLDPKADLMVVILSNRVHPTRANTMFPQKLRPKIHSLVYEMLS